MNATERVSELIGELRDLRDRFELQRVSCALLLPDGTELELELGTTGDEPAVLFDRDAGP